MQTTLRIEDRLYREAKAEAVREGLTMTRFLEEGLQLRLKQGASALTKKKHVFRVYRSTRKGAMTEKALLHEMEKSQKEYDFRKVGK